MKNEKVSDKQLIANRHNAQLGGVKTQEGKALVRFNARKHGICSNFALPDEKDLHQNFLVQLTEQYKPDGLVEKMLIERIAIYFLRLFRATKAERDFVDVTLVKNNPKKIIYAVDIDFLAKYFARYETTIENRLYKALHELERIQRLRQGEDIPAPIPIDVSGDDKNS